MRKSKLFTLAAVLTLSMAALTACTVAEAATHPSESQKIEIEPADKKVAEMTHAPSNRLEDILERGYIEIATEPYFAPNEFIDPTKTGDEQYAGSDIELAKYIADELGVELRIKPMDFTSVLGSITSGKFDLAISALAYTPNRAETMNLSKGYYFGNEDPQKSYGILIRKEDADEIQTIEDLSDKKLVAQNGSLQEIFIKEQITSYSSYTAVSSTNDAFLMVQTGRADAMAASLNMAELYLESNPESGLMILPNFYFRVDVDTQGIRIGIQKGEDELTERINEIIDEILQQDLYNQWYEESRDYAKSLGFEV